MIKVKYIFLSLAVFWVSSCYKESDFSRTNFTFDSLIESIDIEKSNLQANGMDLSEIRVLFNPNSQNDTINFSASLTTGLFRINQNDTISLKPKFETNNEGKRQKLIRFTIVASKKVEDSELRMELNGLTKTVKLKFERCFPENIEVVASPRVFSRKRLENVELKTIISKKEGEPSFGTELMMLAVDSLGNSIGEIVKDCNFNDDNKNCTALFNIWPDTAYIGQIKINTQILNAPIGITNEITLFTTN